MNLEKLKNDLNSESMREMVSSLVTVIDRVRNKEIEVDQAGVEVAAHKHILQGFMVDGLIKPRILRQASIIAREAKVISKK